MDAPSLPDAYLHGEVPVACIERAAADHRVDPLVLLAIMRAENGRVGRYSVNKDGSRDYGPMQINSLWLEKLKEHGVGERELKDNACVNVYVGAWVLSQCLSRYGKDYWRGVGCYHSNTRYPVDRNGWYAARVWKYYSSYVSAISKN